jgi:hypothetical protein
MYKALLPEINSGKVELLDRPRLLNQLLQLERRTGAGGRGLGVSGPVDSLRMALHIGSNRQEPYARPGADY